MSNGLDPDQDRRSVGPDLGPNSLLRVLEDDKCRRFDCMEPNTYNQRWEEIICT